MTSPGLSWEVSTCTWDQSGIVTNSVSSLPKCLDNLLGPIHIKCQESAVEYGAVQTPILDPDFSGQPLQHHLFRPAWPVTIEIAER